MIRYGQSITDQHGNIWTITADHRVAVNGVADPKTASVTHLAYVNDMIWFENSSNLWRSETAPSASWSAPTSAAPYFVPNNVVLGAPLTAGPEQSGIRDGSGNTWSIINGKVAVDGVVDPTTANVIELACVGGRIWQENSKGLWWYKTTPASSWSGGEGIAKNPVGSTFYMAGGATIYVDKVTAMSGVSPEHTGDHRV
ncbi:MAG: hypothetical protein ACJ8AW_34965 [Rhodopila sp.]